MHILFEILYHLARIVQLTNHTVRGIGNNVKNIKKKLGQEYNYYSNFQLARTPVPIELMATRVQ